MPISDVGRELAERLDLPAGTLEDAMRVTITGKNRLMVEHHQGLLGYEDDRITVRGRQGQLRVLGRGLRLCAMDRNMLLIGGSVAAVELD